MMGSDLRKNKVIKHGGYLSAASSAKFDNIVLSGYADKSTERKTSIIER